MAYTVITDLPEKYAGDMSGVEHFIIAEKDYTYKIKSHEFLSWLSQPVEALDERVTELEKMLFQQGTAPTTEQGLSDGDLWLDTAEDVIKVYREYPSGSGEFSWVPLIYKFDDVIDCGDY